MGMVTGSSTTPPAVKKEKCEYCKKDKHELASKFGKNIGNSGTLSRRIISKSKDHRWYIKGWSIAAHHLICSESMKNDDWEQYCRDFGYDINHKNNGVMLPMLMDLSCQLHAPLHKSNHSAGAAEGIPYPDKIITDLREYTNDIKAGNYCDNPDALIDDLNEYSEFVLGEINAFRWTITTDGRDYNSGGIGCAGATGIPKKPSIPCPHDRNHDLTRPGDTAVIPRNSQPLQIGK